MENEKRIEAEAHEIAHCIRRLAMLDHDSRVRVIDTIQAYYELPGDTWPEQLKAMQERMADSTEQLKKIFEDSAPPAMGVGAIERITDPEEVALRELVKEFSDAMLERLLQKSADGWRGWDGDDEEMFEDFWVRMNKHVARWRESPGNMRDIIDTANFCAFIWHHRRKS